MKRNARCLSLKMKLGHTVASGCEVSGHGHATETSRARRTVSSTSLPLRDTTTAATTTTVVVFVMFIEDKISRLLDAVAFYEIGLDLSVVRLELISAERRSARVAKKVNMRGVHRVVDGIAGITGCRVFDPLSCVSCLATETSGSSSSSAGEPRELK